MKIIYHYLYNTLLLLLAAICMACNDDTVPTKGDSEGTVSVEFTLQFPKTNVVATRTMGDVPHTDLDLYLFVFDNNILTQKIYIPASKQTFGSPDGIFSKFKTELSTTDGNAIIHLIAISDPESEFAKALNSLELFGTESNVMFNPNFPTTANGQDAYWQRIDLGMPIEKKENSDTEVTDKVKEQLQRIPMIRNFAQVSMENKANNFELVGFEVINARDRGTIVPAFADADGNTRFAEFDASKLDGTTSSYYAKISAQGYMGRNAAGAARIENKRTEDLPNTATWYVDATDKYLYERQFAATNHIYVIMAGRYNGGATTYYKLDLGSVDENNLFTYYNLLRNIDYHFIINSVADNGYATPAAAAAGATFNNFSASVELRNMLNISDGTNMLYVNFTSYVIVSKEGNYPIEFRYKYYTNIQNKGGTLNNNQIEARNDIVGPKAGDVIERVEFSDSDIDGWRTIKIYPNEPTAELKQQTFTIYDPNGLSRTITLISKTPWEINKMDTYPGLWEDFEAAPWDWGDDKREIGHSAGSPLTLFFELPENLPESMFPLQFVIESSKQNIENAYVGTAVVQSAPSLFDSNNIRIQYTKTVSYYDYDETGDNPNASRVVHCRFLTITDLEDDNIGDNNDKTTSETTLRVSNPYFIIRDDGFTRDSKTSDPSPKVWDFSSADFASIMERLRSETGATGSWSSNGLTISSGGNNSMKSGSETDEDGTTYSYIRTSSANNSFQFSHAYPGPDARTAQLVITASNENNKAEDPAASLTVTTRGTGVNVVTPDNPGFTTRDTRVYNIEIPANDNKNFATTVIVNPRGVMRIYKIEYYPRGTENLSIEP